MTVKVVEAGDANEVLDLEKAREVGDTLAKHYPNHPWVVHFQGRVLIVRHMAIHDLVVLQLGQSGFGALIKHADAHSASDLAHSAMLMGGQMLEAFGLPRGAWDGRAPVLPRDWDKKYAKQGFRDRIIR